MFSLSELLNRTVTLKPTYLCLGLAFTILTDSRCLIQPITEWCQGQGKAFQKANTVDSTETVTNLQPGLGVLSEDLPIHRDIVLGQPLAEQDGSGQSGLMVNVGEVFHGHHVHVLVSPVTLLILNQPIAFEQTTKINAPDFK